MDAVDEVKERLVIEDVIGEYVQLKRTGRNWKGISPFTSEKTASFVVSPEKQIWKDFSSGKGGSVFDFVMEVEGLDFKGALELLAPKAGVDLEKYRTGPGKRGGPDKDRLYELLELSTKFYQVQFSKHQTALGYVFKERKFSKETALKWRLGYSPNNGQALMTFAISKGFSEAELKQAGLSSQSYRGGQQDMFRGRLMIPLQDPQGKVIGFTARELEEGNAQSPKYINTPQTVLYDKSRHVYGLNLAKESIRKSNFSVLVEGNLDVIASHQAGVSEAVATAGTAMTEYQLKSLSRLSPNVRLCFDSDRAGIAATERAIPIASRTKVSLSIIELSSGKDPDELIRQDPKLWRQSVENYAYALDWLIKRYKKELDITSAVGKRKFSDILLPIIHSLSDAVEKDHYLNLVSKILDVSRDALGQKLVSNFGKEKVVQTKAIKKSSELLTKADLESRKVQDRFLSLMLSRKTLREFLELMNEEMMFNEEGRSLIKLLKSKPDYDQNDTKSVRNIADYVKIEALLYEELYQGLDLNELHDEAARLQADLVTKFVKTEKEKLSNAQRGSTDEVEMRQLQEKDKLYNLLLNKVKGAAHG
jgi:DNA primase